MEKPGVKVTFYIDDKKDDYKVLFCTPFDGAGLFVLEPTFILCTSLDFSPNVHVYGIESVYEYGPFRRDMIWK